MHYLSIGEAAAALGMAVSTLRRWEYEGRLHPAYRTPGGHRRYEWSALQSLINPDYQPDKAVTLCYARVSSHDQKADLVRQADRLTRWCSEQKIHNVEVITDLGSGLNYKKRGLKRLIRLITLGQISHLVVTHKDRMLRFGSELLFELCRLNGIQVSIIEAEVAMSYEQQLAADVIDRKRSMRFSAFRPSLAIN